MQGKWITYPNKSKEKNLYFRALKEFELESVPDSRSLHITAESYYKLWINGREIGMGPARGTRNVNFYDTYEVSSFLKSGINQITVLVSVHEHS